MKKVFLINFIKEEISEILGLDRDEYQGFRIFDELSNAKNAVSKLSIQNKLLLIEDIDYEIIEIPLNDDFYINQYPLIIGGNVKSIENVEKNEINNAIEIIENKNFTLIIYKSNGEIHHKEYYDGESQATKRLKEQQEWGFSGEIIENKI